MPVPGRSRSALSSLVSCVFCSNPHALGLKPLGTATSLSSGRGEAAVSQQRQCDDRAVPSDTLQKSNLQLNTQSSEEAQTLPVTAGELRMCFAITDRWTFL